MKPKGELWVSFLEVQGLPATPQAGHGAYTYG